MEVGCARDQHEGERAVISPASEHRTTLPRGMEDGMRPCSIRAGALAAQHLSSHSCLWKGEYQQRFLQLSHGKCRVASPVETG